MSGSEMKTHPDPPKNCHLKIKKIDNFFEKNVFLVIFQRLNTSQ